MSKNTLRLQIQNGKILSRPKMFAGHYECAFGASVAFKHSLSSISDNSAPNQGTAASNIKFAFVFKFLDDFLRSHYVQYRQFDFNFPFSYSPIIFVI